MIRRQIKGHLAWLDILGFKEIASRNPQYTGNLKMLIQQVGYAAVHGMIEERKTSLGDRAMFPKHTSKKVNSIIMSDAFIFYTNGTSKMDFYNLLVSVWWLMPNGYAAIDHDFAMRGAVTKGDIDITLDSNRLIDSIVVVQGDAAMEAVELEGRIQGGICVLSEDLDAEAQELKNIKVKIKNQEGDYNPIIYYPIPIQKKNSIQIKDRYCINWPKSPVGISALPNKFKRMAELAESNKNKKAELQAKNTCEFYDSILEGRPPSYKISLACC